MIKKSMRTYLFSLLFLLSSAAHFIYADYHEQIEHKSITFINTTGYPLLATFKPIKINFECPLESYEQTTECYINLNKTDSPQVISLSKQILKTSRPIDEEHLFTRIIDMSTASMCIIDMIGASEPTECDIENLEFDRTYQISYVDGILTVSLVS